MENEFREEIEALEELKSYNVKMVKTLKEIIPELKGQKKEDTDEYFQHILKGLNWEIQVLNGTMNYLNRNEIIIDKEKLNRSISELNSAISDKNECLIIYAIENLFSFFENLNGIIDNEYDVYIKEDEIKKPKVSVVMPCYNHAEYVGEAIRSVLNQTYSNFEFLIVDNGSTDNSFDVINSFKDTRIKIFRLKTNSIPRAYKMLLDNASGQYIAMMFSDDIWEIEKLQKQMNMLTTQRDVLVCTTWADVISDDSNILESSDIFKKKNRSRLEWLRFLLENGNCLSICSVVAREDIFRKYLMLQAGYWQLPDYYAWLLTLQETNIYMVEESLVKVRFHGKKENQNLSYPSEINTLRTVTERKNIVLRVIEQISDSDFIQMYRDKLINHSLENHIDILCEKFYVLLYFAEINSSFQDNIFSFYYKYFLYEENGVTMGEVLQNKYNFSTMDFSELSGKIGSTVELFKKDIYENNLLKKLRSLLSDDIRMQFSEISNRLNNITLCLLNESFDMDILKEYVQCLEEIEKKWDILDYMEIKLRKEELLLCKDLCEKYLLANKISDKYILFECAMKFRQKIDELLV